MSPDAILTVDAKASCCELRSLALIKYTFGRRPKESERPPRVAAPSRITQNLRRKGKLMARRTFKIIGLASSLLVVALGASSQMQAQSNTPYPSMAALDQYLMDRNAEIA